MDTGNIPSRAMAARSNPPCALHSQQDISVVWRTYRSPSPPPCPHRPWTRRSWSLPADYPILSQRQPWRKQRRIEDRSHARWRDEESWGFIIRLGPSLQTLCRCCATPTFSISALGPRWPRQITLISRVGVGVARIKLIPHPCVPFSTSHSWLCPAFWRVL